MPKELQGNIDEAVTAITAAAHFGYNANFKEFAVIYGELGSCSDSHYAYLQSKFDMMKEDIGQFIGQLDSEHRRRFVELALKRYAEKG